jgi:site-specific DNA-methyltransferase (cytosine-N4-specific)
MAIKMNNRIPNDFDFKNETTQYLTHKYHSYPARFIPQIPKTVINSFLSPTDRSKVVLDPFVGSGTTCVEARLANKNTIGIDINPLAVLIAKSKCTPVNSSLTETTGILLNNIKNDFSKSLTSKNTLDEFPEHLLGLKKDNHDYVKKSNEYLRYVKEGIKEVKINNKFFLPLTIILKNIKNNDFTSELENYFLVALSSTINTLSKNGREKNHDTTSKDYPITIFEKHLKNMNAEMIKFYELCDKNNYSKIIEGKSWNLPLEEDSVDLVVTSPPYANAFDYHREHKLNILWLGLEYREFKNHEMGAHSLFTANRFRMLTEYLSDMFSSISEMCRVLKKDGTACIVVGNSTIEHMTIETHNHFKHFGDVVGLKFKKEILRNIDVTKKYTSRGIGNIDKEYVIFFEKENYKRPTNELIIETIRNELKNILEQHKNKEVKLDENTITKTQQRKKKERKDTNMKYIKKEIIELNIKKLNNAISNVEFFPSIF